MSIFDRMERRLFRWLFQRALNRGARGIHATLDRIPDHEVSEVPVRWKS